MQKIRSDVAVIGAGPAGSTTARVIAESGFDVLLIEKDKFPGKSNVCGGAVPRVIIHDIGVPDTIIEKEVHRENHHFPWGIRTNTIDNASVNRCIFDNYLADKAVDAGAELLTSTTVREIFVNRDGALLSSTDTAIESKIVVFADGPNTLAYKKFGIGFAPYMDKTAVAAICEIEWADNPLDTYEFYYSPEIAPWGYGWIFPKKNIINVGVGCLYSKVRTNIADSLNILIHRHPLTQELLKGKKPGPFRSATIPFAPGKRIFGERMLVVGDAAGMVNCITGGGIAAAVTGSKIVGGVCTDALEREDFSAEFLSRYQALWQNSPAYSNIYSRYLLSTMFLYYSRFDENAFPHLMAIAQGGMKNIFGTLKSIYTP